jgi:hypothetical protein
VSHTICDRCGIRYRDEHECAEDGDAMLQRIRDLENDIAELPRLAAQIRVLESQVRSLQMSAPRGIPATEPEGSDT